MMPSAVKTAGPGWDFRHGCGRRAETIPQVPKRVGSQALNVGAKAPTPKPWRADDGSFGWGWLRRKSGVKPPHSKEIEPRFA